MMVWRTVAITALAVAIAVLWVMAPSAGVAAIFGVCAGWLLGYGDGMRALAKELRRRYPAEE